MFAPTYTISATLLRTIKQIAVLVHDLNKLIVPTPTLAHLVSEAEITAVFASTSIEGNPLPLTEVRRLLKNDPIHKRDSEKEVLNYNAALQMLHAAPGAGLTEEWLLTIHAQVMAGLLPAHQAGRYRQHPVVIHDPRTQELVFLPPDHADVPALMGDLIQFVDQQRGVTDALIVAGLFHKQFMLIHPFIDGNGRTGRLATKRLLAELGLDFFPLLSFENFYNRNVTRYFRFVGEQGSFYDIRVDFTAWLEYFAGGILDQLLIVQQQVATPTSPETSLQPHHEMILAYIDAHGFITDRDYAKLTERAKSTRALDFRKLLALGLIQRRGKGRNTHYIRPA